MQVRQKLFAVSFALAALAGCGDDPIGVGDLQLSDLEGTWTVRQQEYTSDDGDNQEDLIGDQTTGTATVLANGQYTVTLQTNQFTANYTGTISLGDQTATLTLVSPPASTSTSGTADLELDGDLLTVRFENARYDFEDDDTTGDVNADLVWVWEKQAD